jgi:hypothetical protein
MIRIRKYWLIVAVLAVVALVPVVVPVAAQSNTGEGGPANGTTLTIPRATDRDGQHDFDFEFGTWKTKLRRLVRPLTGSTTWVEYEGTTVVRPVLNGRANLVELTASGPAGSFAGMSLRLYNPQSRQWSLNFANVSDGSLAIPTIGEFHDGRGEFYDQETLNGRAIFVRFVITVVNADTCRFEQAYSADGGKTWEVNWVAVDSRVKE